jgi:hypothetical protein
MMKKNAAALNMILLDYESQRIGSGAFTRPESCCKILAMNCPEHSRLLGHFERTARAYADAVGELRGLSGFDLIAQQKLVAHIREACDNAQALLANHEQAHGCVHIGSSVPSLAAVER